MQELMKQIVARMPTDKADVFAYPIAWAAYDGAPLRWACALAEPLCRPVGCAYDRFPFLTPAALESKLARTGNWLGHGLGSG